MKKNILFLLFLLFSGINQNYVNAQNICLGNDASVCIGSSVTIEDCNPGSGPGSFIGLSNLSTLHTLTDDSYSNVVNLGFSFEFYGNTYTQCVVGSNGVVTFDLSKAGGYCPWALGAVGMLPTPGFDDGLNTLMPAYHDMNPSGFASPIGEVRTETVGTAPNRKLLILYKDIIAFGANAGECSYMGIIINETANSFEFHIGNKPIVTTWNGGLAIQGSQNQAGTLAHITPGRNNEIWAAFQEAKIWTPTSPVNTSNYTISDIPYTTFISPTSTFAWGNTANNTVEPYNNGILVINSVTPGITGYFLTAAGTGCGPVGGTSDTTFITGVSSAVNAIAIDDICSSGIGEVTAMPLAGIPIYTYDWPGLGVMGQTVTGVTAGTYTVNMIDGNGCLSSANVTVGDLPAAFQGTTSMVSCVGGNDGTAFAEMIPALGNITYLWDDPSAQTTQTAIGLTAGNYSCTITSDVGCFGVVLVTVTEIPGMIGTITSQTDVTCNSGNDGMIEVNVTQGTPPYSYSWDNSSSITNISNDLIVGPHTVTITDFNGCIITIDGTLNQPPPLSISALTPNTQICPEDAIMLSVTGTGGSSPYTFEWFEENESIGFGSNIIVDPDLTNTNYCVTITEACGSPSSQECTMIFFPTPILPMAVPDELFKCVPDTFYFANTSSNSLEIANTFWEFDNNITHNELVNGSDSTSHYYNQNGFQTLTLTVTSIFGCVYVDTLENLFEVLPSPTADFNFSSNPTTIFETTISLQDKSSFNVIDWQWISPGSTPTSSGIPNPVFMFPDGELGTYPITLIVTTERGCIDTTTYLLNVIEDILFFAPNAFTPDGNELNQVWMPIISGIDIYDFELIIYNRWGEVIWENHDPSVGWDGTYRGLPMMNNTYIWTAVVKSPFQDDRRTFKGSFTILRGTSNISPQ